jgi:hypothetical protein
MRHSNLAAAVIFGVGIFTGQTSAQPALAPAQTHADQAMQDTLRRRVLAALEAAMKAKGADLKRFPLNGDVPNLLSPMDCGMPVITGDPAIDPQFSKQPKSPPGKSFWSMKVIPVKPCPR